MCSSVHRAIAVMQRATCLMHLFIHELRQLTRFAAGLPLLFCYQTWETAVMHDITQTDNPRNPAISICNIHSDPQLQHTIQWQFLAMLIESNQKTKQNPDKRQIKHTSRKRKPHQNNCCFSKTDTAIAEVFSTLLLDLCSGKAELFSWFHP